MSDADEIAELHRLSGQAFAACFAESPGLEVHLTRNAGLAMTGEPVADLNMLFVGPPAAEGAAFLDEAMARAEARSLPLLCLMDPRVSDALSSAAARHGLNPAGTVPLMVLRGPPRARPARECRIEAARGPELAPIVADLVSAAFAAPRDIVGRVLEPNITPTSAAVSYIAFAGETPMSSVTVTRTGDTAGVWSMATPPERQGQGMGRALLTHVIEDLRREGVRRFYLFATAAGFPLYRSLGFETLAEDAAWVKGHSTQVHG